MMLQATFTFTKFFRGPFIGTHRISVSKYNTSVHFAVICIWLVLRMRMQATCIFYFAAGFNSYQKQYTKKETGIIIWHKKLNENLGVLPYASRLYQRLDLIDITRAFDHIAMEKACYKFLIIITIIITT